MATATSFTSARMLEIEKASVVSARRENGELILTTRGGTDINVGDVTGSQGPPGPDGVSRYTWLKYATTPTSGMSDDPTGKNYIGLAYNKITAIESNDYNDYQWTLLRGPEGQQGVPGPPGDDGESTYVWIKYADTSAGSGMSDNPTNKDYIGFAYNKTTPVESTNPADYAWSLIKGPKGDKGEDGADGLPGPPGTDGLPNYTWLKYATTPTTGMSDDPTGKDYIGLAYNKGTSTESTDYADYTWSLIRGPQGNQGVPGTPGTDGTPRYVWIKYANTVAGDGMSDDPTGKDYIGLAYNKTTAIESDQPLDYTWSLYKGPQGADGEDGRGIVSSEITYQASWSGVLVPTGTWLTDPPVLSPGQYLWTRTKTNYNAAPFEVLSYSVGQMGQTGNTGAAGISVTGAVVRYQLHNNGTTPPTGTWLVDPPAGSPGQYVWTRTVTTYSSGGDTVAFSVSMLGQTGPQGVQGPAGEDGDDGRGITGSEIRYQASANGVDIPGGTWLVNPPAASPGQYVWTRTRTFFNLAPTEVVSYSVGRIGETGAQGVQGNQGIQGPAGTSYYTWLKYADSPTTGMSDSPAGKTYIGLAHNKTTATESSNYGDYTWSLIKGEQGVQGPSGANGQPTYTWIKYATSSSGAGISDDPTGKIYIGLAYNKSTIVESNNPADYTWSLIQGPAGDPGESVTGQTVGYQLSGNGTSVPGGSWLANPPAGSPGQYMWTRITFHYSTAADTHAYSVAMLGNTGATGAPAPVIVLTATTQVLKSPAAGGATTPATSVVTGTAANTSITSWQYSVNGAAFTSTLPAGTTRSGNVVTITGQTMTAATITVQMADANGIADTLTVAKISDGAQGAQGPTGNTGNTGATGAPAYTVLLTNEAHTFGGDVNNALVGSTSIGILAYKGTTQQTVTVGTITGQVAGLTTSISNNSTTTASIAVTVTTALTTLNGTLTIPLTVDGVAFTKTFAWSVSRKGAQGVQGNTGAAGAPAYTVLLTNEAHTFSGDVNNALAGSTSIGTLAYKGTTQQSVTVGTITGQVTGLTTSISNNNSTTASITVTVTTALVTINGTLTIPLTVDGVAFTKTFAWSVSRKGTTGSPAPVITVTATTQALKSPAAGGATTPATASVVGTAVNTTITSWQYSINGAAFADTVPTGVSRTGNTVTITGQTMTAATIAVKMGDANGVADTITVSKISDGAQGAQGPTGDTGATGRGISSTTITYQAGSSGTSIPGGTWVSSPPAVSPGQFLWTKTTLTYSTGSPPSTDHYSVGGMGTKIDTVVVRYKLSNSPTTVPGDPWSETPLEQTDALPYLWTRTVTTYLGGPATTTAYSVARRGVGVTKVESVYGVKEPIYTNDFETLSGSTVEVRRNYATRPRATAYLPEVTSGLGFNNTRWVGEGSYSLLTGIEGPPETDITTAVRYTVTTAHASGHGFHIPANLEAGTPAATTGLAVIPGEIVTASCWIRKSGIAASVAIRARAANASAWIAATYNGNVASTIDGQWVRVSVTYTVPADTTRLQFMVTLATTDAIGDTIDATGLLIEKRPSLSDYFDGDYSPDLDLTPSWLGTTNDSASRMIAPTVKDATTVQVGHNFAFISTSWYKRGLRSIRVFPTSTSNNTWVAPGGDNGALRLGMEAGKTYTVFAICRIPEGRVAASTPYISVQRESWAAVLNKNAPSNQPGEYFVIGTFTVPPTATSIFIRLYANAIFGSGNSVWWDDFQLFEGNIDSDLTSWGNTLPSYEPGKTLFRSEKVTFTDGTISYSDPQVEPLWNTLSIALAARDSAEEATAILADHSLTIYGDDDSSGLVTRMFLLENDTGENPSTALGALIRSIGITANGKNAVARSLDGAINPQNYTAGDQWFQYNSSGQIINFWIHDGDDWVETKLNGGIFGSVDAGVLTSGYISSERIAVNSIPRDKIDNLPQMLAELQAVDGSGEVSQAVRDLLSSIEIGTGVIKITTPGVSESTSYRMELRSNKLAFMRGETETASISDNTLVISNAKIATEIGDSLVFAAHDVFKGGTSGLAGKVTVFRSI